MPRRGSGCRRSVGGRRVRTGSSRPGERTPRNQDDAQSWKNEARFRVDGGRFWGPFKITTRLPPRQVPATDSVATRPALISTPSFLEKTPYGRGRGPKPVEDR